MSVSRLRSRHRNVQQLARILASMDVPQAPSLLKKCFELGSAATRRQIANMARGPISKSGHESQEILYRTHNDLILSHHVDGDMVVLEAEAPDGPRQELIINDVARDAIAFVCREPSFEMRALPGNLSQEERMALAEALEETGLFTMVKQ